METGNQRTKILEAAARVFRERGFRGATTKLIAWESGVSEGAIYYHFASKRELLLCVLDHIMSDVRGDGSLPIDDGAPVREVYKRLAKERVSRAQPQIETLLGLLSEVMGDRELGREAYARVIAPSIAGAEFLLAGATPDRETEGPDLRLVARILTAVGLGLDMLQQMGDETVHEALRDPERLAEAMTCVFFDGLSRRLGGS